MHLGTPTESDLEEGDCRPSDSMAGNFLLIPRLIDLHDSIFNNILYITTGVSLVAIH
jgi:hypothetical protein